MELAIIAAVSDNNVIGIRNRIPWNIKEDIERFKRLTLDHPVIMGRRTYESIPERFRPLPQRKNIILSRNLEQKEGIFVAGSIKEALEFTENQDSYVIGGAEIYKLFLPVVNRIEFTRVHKQFPGDSFFPEINLGGWDLINKEDGLSKDGIPYSFLTYVRR